MITELNHILPIPGIRIATAAAGIRYRDRDDLVLFELAPGSVTSAVFTRNVFCAAPVTVAREHLQRQQPRYLIINAGNANAGTGERGVNDANRVCAIVAASNNCQASEVLPFSTGVIGQALPVHLFDKTMPALVSALNPTFWPQAARAIMTTDTRAKAASVQFSIADKTISISGIAKGAGMIKPDMATLLSFVATDVAIDPEILKSALKDAVNMSFNRITIDGDTSTNDACVLIASQQAGNPVINDLRSPSGQVFLQALKSVMLYLAQAVVRDGEGATKFVTINVNGGRSEQECLQVAYTIAHSPLVKTALFASDPNWGRILAAIGRAEIHELDIRRVSLYLGQVAVIVDGQPASDYTEAAGSAVMQQKEFAIRVVLGRGAIHTEIWTCDLSHDYVTINAEYRS